MLVTELFKREILIAQERVTSTKCAKTRLALRLQTLYRRKKTRREAWREIEKRKIEISERIEKRVAQRKKNRKIREEELKQYYAQKKENWLKQNEIIKYVRQDEKKIRIQRRKCHAIEAMLERKRIEEGRSEKETEQKKRW